MNSNYKFHLIIGGLTGVTLLVSSLCLKQLIDSPEENKQVSQVASLVGSDASSQNPVDDQQADESSLSKEPQQFIIELLQQTDPENQESLTQAKDKLHEQFDSNLLTFKPEIIRSIRQLRLNPEDLGYLFLPDYPSQESNLQHLQQINIPLILQKDIRWRKLPYGTDGSQTLGENGCAIVSLAMMESYYQNKPIDPKDILDWSHNDFYVHNEGTSWQIFSAFAQDFDYEFYNYGGDFYQALQDLNDDKIILASVKPGYLTDIGHIVLIRGYHDGKVYINDPNDDPSKMFSVQGIDESILLEDGLNYWSFKKNIRRTRHS
ncbi:C39 family peptidase [Hutsoniella sourekii]|uniref:C39 family peptidase n=1 Tax=Hutsoniella sourekii TaxID=87650 RepID=UPI0004B07877|nr:C39 family peptidase [Hutsoniella sourekii]